MAYPFQPPGHIPGFHRPGTLDPMFDPALLAAQQAVARQAAAEAALAAGRQRMAGRWFTPEHEWVAVNGEIATVGITGYAARALGDIVYVSLPAAGATVTAGEPCGQVESTTAISDLHSPVGGKVTEVNARLDAEPGVLNDEPYGAGWMFRVDVGAGGEAPLPPDLLSPAEYEELTESVG